MSIAQLSSRKSSLKNGRTNGNQRLWRWFTLSPKSLTSMIPLGFPPSSPPPSQVRKAKPGISCGTVRARVGLWNFRSMTSLLSKVTRPSRSLEFRIFRNSLSKMKMASSSPPVVFPPRRPAWFPTWAVKAYPQWRGDDGKTPKEIALRLRRKLKISLYPDLDGFHPTKHEETIRWIRQDAFRSILILRPDPEPKE